MSDKIQNTRHFDWKTPLFMNGREYPTTEFGVEDNLGNVVNTRVGVDANGQYFTVVDGKAQPIIRSIVLPEVSIKGFKEKFQKQNQELLNNLNSSQDRANKPIIIAPELLDVANMIYKESNREKTEKYGDTPLLHLIMNKLIGLTPEWLQNYAYQAAPYVRQWYDYNDGGNNWGLETAPKLSEQYLQDAIREKLGKRNLQTGDTLYSVPLGSESKTYSKYLNAGGDSAVTANAMYSQLGTIEKVVSEPDNKYRIIDTYDWEPPDTQEGFISRLKKQYESANNEDGNYTWSDVLRTLMERPAQWASQYNITMPDKNKPNVRTGKKHESDLRPTSHVGFDFKIDQK